MVFAVMPEPEAKQARVSNPVYNQFVDSRLAVPRHSGMTKPQVSEFRILDSMSLSTLMLGALIVYAAAGLATALAFVTFGVVRVLPNPAPVSIPARIVLIPATAALWPYVLCRWLKSR
jgi:hypothetical protein